MRWSSVFRTFLYIMLILVSSLAAGQKSKAQLEKEKGENLKRIAEAEKILIETEKERKASMGQLRALNQQIAAREGLIESLNQEVLLLDSEIRELSIIVRALQSDYENLRKEYAAMIYAAYKANRGYSRLTFIFSAATFNQLFQRLKYLEQYAEARKIQVKQIEEVARELNEQKNQMEIKRAEQRKVLAQQIEENKKLVSLKVRQSNLVADLSGRERDLKRELDDRKKAVAQLDNLIDDIVRKEIERSKTLSSTALANEEELSGVFESNKNKLIWPVSPGFVSQKFGQHPHPVLKGIVEDNPGINIQTSANASVRNVFNGKVIQKVYVPGMNNAVIVQHGEYYTLYAKLKEVNVKIGQSIGTNEVIGTVSTDSSGLSELHFEVWKQRIKLNPEQWLILK